MRSGSRIVVSVLTLLVAACGPAPETTSTSPAPPPPAVTRADAEPAPLFPKRPLERPADHTSSPLPPTIAAPVLGSSVIRLPASMKEGDEAVARLVVSPDQLTTLLRDPAVAGAKDVRDQRAAVQLMPRMRASLSAPGFDIDPKDEQEQLVKVGEATEWVWTLVPGSAGTRTLVFTLEGVASLDGRDVVVRPPALIVPVTVAVSPLFFITRNWKWFVTALIAPLVAFFGKRWLDRRSATATGHP